MNIASPATPELRLRLAAFLLFVFFAFLPMWLAVAIVAWAFLALGATESAYMTLWLIVVAVALCPLSFVVTSLATVAMAKTGGGMMRKLLFGVGPVVLIAAGLFVHGALERRNRQDAERAAVHRADELAVVELVRNNAFARRMAGGVPTVRASGQVMRDAQGLPYLYEVIVDGDRTVHAVVHVKHDSRRPFHQLSCLTHEPLAADVCLRAGALRIPAGEPRR